MQSPFARYSRQIFIEEVSIEGQRKIMQAKVLVIGAGGLGSPVIQYLAGAGVGCLAAVDFDILEIHNLNRQVIHRENQLGRFKVDSASKYVQEFNSTIKFQAINEKLSPKNIDRIIQDYDIVVDGSDNFSTRYLVNDACVKQGKVLVYGSIFAFQGQVAVFNFHGSKHLRDLFPVPPSDEEIQNCDRFGVLGPLPGIVGSMMAMQVLKIIVDLPVLVNELTLIDTKNWQFNQVNF